MQALLAPLRELAEYEEIRNILYKDKKSIALTGCVESQKLHMIYGLGDGFPCNRIPSFPFRQTICRAIPEGNGIGT